MEFFDYDDRDEEYDKIFEEAPPCSGCDSKDFLALAVLTDIEHHGTLVLFCARCDVEKKEEDNFPVEDTVKTRYV